MMGTDELSAPVTETRVRRLLDREGALVARKVRQVDSAEHTEGTQIAATSEAMPLGRLQLDLGECPTWDVRSHRWLCVDASAGRVFGLGPPPEVLQTLPPPLSAVFLCQGGRWISASNDQLIFADGQAFAQDLAGGQTLRCNDGKVGPDGTLVVGLTSGSLDERSGRLIRVTPGGMSTVLVTDMAMPNGLDWSPDGAVLFVADSGRGEVRAFDVARLHRPQPWVRGRLVVAIPRAVGLPDGLTVDDGGTLWLAVWGTGQVRGYGDNGRWLHSIQCPTSLVTSCAFGGPDRRVMLITTARRPRDDQAAGGVYYITMEVPGPVARVLHTDEGD